MKNIQASFCYNEEGGAEFTISYLTRKEREGISKKAIKKEKQWKKSKKDSEFDIDMHLITKEIILKSIVGWENVTNKTLKEILDPETFGENWCFMGEKKEGSYDSNFEIEFNKENLELLAESHSENFKSFSNFALDKLTEELKEKNSNLLKNF